MYSGTARTNMNKIWWLWASDDALAATPIDVLVERFTGAFGSDIDAPAGRAALYRLAWASHARGAACVVCGEAHS